ncbi:MAG: hypothetical protein F4187_06630 [Gemmatimonadetes bacterium]|nr:hypothetical protein [Gemmatimonadota bacterium]
MRHRHLNHSRLTLAAIDHIIARGQWRHWAAAFVVGRAPPVDLDRQVAEGWRCRCWGCSPRRHGESRSSWRWCRVTANVDPSSTCNPNRQEVCCGPAVHGCVPAGS